MSRNQLRGQSKQVHDLVASRILRTLQQRQALPEGKEPDWAEFHAFRERVHRTFFVPESSITPLMARVFWGLAWIAHPRHLLVLGSYAGNSLIWLAGPVLNEAKRVIGIDSDPAAVTLARQNFQRFAAHQVTLLCGDALQLLHQLPAPVDLVLLDIDDPQERKAPYVRLLDAVYDLLAPGALVLAHDICVERFQKDLAPYLTAVRQSGRFRLSLPLEIDPCGLELSVKKGDCCDAGD